MTECFFDSIVECVNELQKMRMDTDIKKEDVIDSVELRMHVMMRRMAEHIYFPFLSTNEWKNSRDVVM